MPSRLPLQPRERVMRSGTEALHPIKWDAMLQCRRSIRQASIGGGGTFAHRIRTVPRVRLQHITQPIGLRFAFSSENRERDSAFNAKFRSARMPSPFMGRTSSPPQTWDFAVRCAHIGAHAMLHSGHSVCARTKCAVSGVQARKSGEMPNTTISA